MAKFFTIVPSFLWVGILYNIFIVIAGVHLDSNMFSFEMASGALCQVEVQHVFIFLGLVAEFIEVMVSTRSSESSRINLLLSVLVFALYLVEFLLVKRAGTATFAIIGALSLLDVAGGFNISIATRRASLDVR